MNIKILIIDSSSLLRNFLKDKLTKLGFNIILAKDGLQGLIFMRNQLPDLIIMDFYLEKLDGVNFLKEKAELKGTKDISLIILSSAISRDTILKLGKFKINKLLSKPLQFDLLLQTIGNIFNLQFEIDKTPCKIEVHYNDDILFIEAGIGFNIDKIELMKYKIIEIKDLYNVEILKVLIIITDIEEQKNLDEMLDFFMNSIINTTKISLNNINILTRNQIIQRYFKDHNEYNVIKLVEDFVKAIENLGKIDLYFSNQHEIENVQKDMLSGKNLDEQINRGSIDLKFSDESLSDIIQDEKALKKDKKFTIAVVDDDLSILELMEEILTQNGWDVVVFDNGKSFLNDLKSIKPDLIFLDLLMPVMSGFEVLQILHTQNNNVPIIILSALSDKESIIRARNFGIKSYLTKPANVKFITFKVMEILNSNF